MIRQVILGLAAVTMVGCSSNGTFDVGSKEDAAKYANFAASTPMPTTAPSPVNGTSMAALTSGGSLKLYNFSKNNIDNAAVWINGQYVTKVDSIPAMSETSVDFSHFYDKAGDVLNTDKTPPMSVSVENGSMVMSLLGPMVQ